MMLPDSTNGWYRVCLPLVSLPDLMKIDEEKLIFVRSRGWRQSDLWRKGFQISRWLVVFISISDMDVFIYLFILKIFFLLFFNVFFFFFWFNHHHPYMRWYDGKLVNLVTSKSILVLTDPNKMVIPRNLKRYLSTINTT